MKVYRGLKDPRLKRSPRSVAIGIFDGVHRGHRKILERALLAARRLRVRPMAVTFEPHPQKVLSGNKHAPKVLMSLEHRLRLFGELGMKETLVIPFTKKFAGASHQDFLYGLLLHKLGMKALSVGDDFRFGHRALGDRHYLEEESR